MPTKVGIHDFAPRQSQVVDADLRRHDGAGTCLWINHFADWYYLILLQPARIVLFEQAPKPTIPEVFDHPSRYVA